MNVEKNEGSRAFLLSSRSGSRRECVPTNYARTLPGSTTNSENYQYTNHVIVPIAYVPISQLCNASLKLRYPGGNIPNTRAKPERLFLHFRDRTEHGGPFIAHVQVYTYILCQSQISEFIILRVVSQRELDETERFVDTPGDWKNARRPATPRV